MLRGKAWGELCKGIAGDPLCYGEDGFAEGETEKAWKDRGPLVAEYHQIDGDKCVYTSSQPWKFSDDPWRIYRCLVVGEEHGSNLTKKVNRIQQPAGCRGETRK